MREVEFTHSESTVLSINNYIGQLTPREGEAPSFVQKYIHDGTAEGELENR